MLIYVKMYLCRGGLFVPIKTEKQYDKYTTRFTFVREEGFGQNKHMVKYPYFKQINGGLLVPRFIADKSVANKVYSEPLDFDVVNTTFEGNQKVICDFVMQRFKTTLKQDNGKPIRTGLVIIAGTGIGKTFIGLFLSNLLRKKTLYIVYDKKSLKSVYETFKTYTTANVGRYYGDKKEDGDIIIMIVNTALNTPKEYFYKFGTIIYDEITEYASHTRIDLFFLTLGVFNIGLTATKTKKGLEIIYEELVGPMLDVTLIPGYNEEEIVFEGKVIKVRHTVSPSKIIRLPGTKSINFMSTIKRFKEDEELTQIVLAKINLLLELDKRVIIFSEIKSYLYHIFYKVNESSKLMFIGGACEEDYEEAKKTKLIFSTYKFAEKALSLKDTDAILYLTPRKDANQSSGRAFRRDGNPFLTRYIVDIIHSCFRGQEAYRDLCYQERKLTIEEAGL